MVHVNLICNLMLSITVHGKSLLFLLICSNDSKDMLHSDLFHYAFMVKNTEKTVCVPVKDLIRKNRIFTFIF